MSEPMTADEALRNHVAKMQTIHGDEPIRIKIAKPWAEELLVAKGLLRELSADYDHPWPGEDAETTAHRQDLLRRMDAALKP